MRCGRRDDPFSRHVGQPAEDRWGDDDTCSYCGSLNPDTLMARLEAGDVALTPTDKNYKVYVRNAGGAPFKQTYRDCPPETIGHEMPEDCTHWVTREVQETKFYFQHLSAEQRTRFIEMLNARKLNLGYPGYFYRLPFFVVPAAPTATRAA